VDTIIRCKDCGFTSAYPCDKPEWQCAKCGKSNPVVLPMPHRTMKKIRAAKDMRKKP
jgi:DNA-directed RNA polymerase subunit RPC12/RpoP